MTFVLKLRNKEKVLYLRKMDPSRRYWVIQLERKKVSLELGRGRGAGGNRLRKSLWLMVRVAVTVLI